MKKNEAGFDTPEMIIQEAERIVELGEEAGITFRLLGACAIRIHCVRFKSLLEQLERKLTDIDFMSYSKFNRRMMAFFEQLDYIPERTVIAYHGRERHIYYTPWKEMVVDVFFDKLEMCHTIDFKGRLELDYPTITLADLLLEKMQIVELNEKDVIDVIVMLREHEIGEKNREKIDHEHIANVLSKDWGFYYTVTTNLNKVKQLVNSYDVLSKEDCCDVSQKIDKLIKAIENKPKSFGWKMRAKIGIKKKWYKEVTEVSQ